MATERERCLQFVVRTPRGDVVDEQVEGVRLPTATGQVGLRPRGEPMVLAVEAGLLSMRARGDTHFVATAGGLLESDRTSATLYTPLAVTGEDEDRTIEALHREMVEAREELETRHRLAELEHAILQELQPGRRPVRPRGRHG